MAETNIVGIVEIGVVGTIETGAKVVVGMGATGMVGVGIPMPTATPSPSKVSTSKEIGIQMKRKYIQEKKVNLAEKKRRHIPLKSGSGGALSS